MKMRTMTMQAKQLCTRKQETTMRQDRFRIHFVRQSEERGDRVKRGVTQKDKGDGGMGEGMRENGKATRRRRYCTATRHP